MCDPVSLIVGIAGAAVGIGTAAYSSHQQKKAAKTQSKATQALVNAQKNSTKTSVSKTASTAKVNDTTKRTISSLRTSSAATVNTADTGTSTGLNIPV